MTEEKFLKVLLMTLQFPFEYEDVKEIVTDLDGGCFIDLQDGSTYHIGISKIEDID